MILIKKLKTEEINCKEWNKFVIRGKYPLTKLLKHRGANNWGQVFTFKDNREGQRGQPLT